MSPELSAIGFANSKDANPGPRRLIVGARFDNGTVGINSWNTTTWRGQDFPTMKGQTFDKFTAMALLAAEDLKFFGITDAGEIQSYTIDRDDPLSWTYDQQVNTNGTVS